MTINQTNNNTGNVNNVLSINGDVVQVLTTKEYGTQLLTIKGGRDEKRSKLHRLVINIIHGFRGR